MGAGPVLAYTSNIFRKFRADGVFAPPAPGRSRSPRPTAPSSTHPVASPPAGIYNHGVTTIRRKSIASRHHVALRVLSKEGLALRPRQPRCFATVPPLTRPAHSLGVFSGFRLWRFEAYCVSMMLHTALLVVNRVIRAAEWPVAGEWHLAAKRATASERIHSLVVRPGLHAASTVRRRVPFAGTGERSGCCLNTRV